MGTRSAKEEKATEREEKSGGGFWDGQGTDDADVKGIGIECGVGKGALGVHSWKLADAGFSVGPAGVAENDLTRKGVGGEVQNAVRGLEISDLDFVNQCSTGNSKGRKIKSGGECAFNGGRGVGVDGESVYGPIIPGTIGAPCLTNANHLPFGTRGIAPRLVKDKIISEFVDQTESI